jgi:hypothetical protein
MGLNLISNYDLDQDGVNDLAAGSYNRWMNAFSGRDGTFLYRWPAWWGVAGSGSSLAMLAPPPGERYPVLVFAESEWWGPTNQPGANGINPGVLYAYRGCPRGVRAYGQPDASPGQDLPRSGMRNPTTQLVRFTLSDAAPSALAVWMLGTSDLTIRGSPLPIPLDPLGFPGITLLTSTEVMVASLTGASGMAAGYANYDVALPPGRVLDTTGTSLFAQWLWLDPNDLRHHGSTAGQRFRVR